MSMGQSWNIAPSNFQRHLDGLFHHPSTRAYLLSLLCTTRMFSSYNYVVCGVPLLPIMKYWTTLFFIWKYLYRVLAPVVYKYLFTLFHFVTSYFYLFNWCFRFIMNVHKVLKVALFTRFQKMKRHHLGKTKRLSQEKKECCKKCLYWLHI